MYLQGKYHPSMVSQTQSRRRRCDRRWCDYADLCSPPLSHHKTEGYLISCKRGRGIRICRICRENFNDIETHRINIMTPTAQQSTGRPYRWRATTSGAEGKHWRVGQLKTTWSCVLYKLNTLYDVSRPSLLFCSAFLPCQRLWSHLLFRCLNTQPVLMNNYPDLSLQRPRPMHSSALQTALTWTPDREKERRERDRTHKTKHKESRRSRGLKCSKFCFTAPLTYYHQSLREINNLG